MNTCRRAGTWFQVTGADGIVRSCGWTSKTANLGSLLNEEFIDIYNGEALNKALRDFGNGDYSGCNCQVCHYMARNKMDEIICDIEDIPETPEFISLSFENKCNYRCTCCTSHFRFDGKAEEENYSIIEKRLRKVLPYVKSIGAHGCGELFASPHILKLLAEWEPYAPDEEVSVTLETNGSLFDEIHWKKIDNLGKYKLTVMVTVMSFKEDVYQFLSGCNYPISKIIENLRFIKRLREENIINELHICTVVQEQNFREMPEFTRRCLDEFGADVVRLRSIIPGGKFSKDVQWFMDVRNPCHPFYNELKKIMANPIFSDERVFMWQGEQDSNGGESPYTFAMKQLEQSNELLSNEYMVSNALYELAINEKKIIGSLSDKYGRIGIFGIGKIGKAFWTSMSKYMTEKNIVLIDSNAEIEEYMGNKVYNPNSDKIKETDAIVISPMFRTEEMKNALKDYEGDVILLRDLLVDDIEK